MITLDESLPVPPYEQIRTQLRAQIVTGKLLVGTRLPTVRRLAGDLGVATNTVGRAYKELESAGLVETRRRGGTTVLAGPEALHAQAHTAALAFAHIMREHGLQLDDSISLVRAAFDEVTY